MFFTEKRQRVEISSDVNKIQISVPIELVSKFGTHNLARFRYCSAVNNKIIPEPRVRQDFCREI